MTPRRGTSTAAVLGGHKTVQLSARAAGRPVLISHQRAVRTREQPGSDLVGWITCRSRWQGIRRSGPDLPA